MDPALLSAGDWHLLARMLNDLFTGTGLGLTAAMAFLLAHAILPSLAATGDIAVELRGARWLCYAIFTGALGLASFALVRAFIEGGNFLGVFYPRFGY